MPTALSRIGCQHPAGAWLPFYVNLGRARRSINVSLSVVGLEKIHGMMLDECPKELWKGCPALLTVQGKHGRLWQELCSPPRGTSSPALASSLSASECLGNKTLKQKNIFIHSYLWYGSFILGQRKSEELRKLPITQTVFRVTAPGELQGSHPHIWEEQGAFAPDSFHVHSLSHRQTQTSMFIVFQLCCYKESIIE